MGYLGPIVFFVVMAAAQRAGAGEEIDHGRALISACHWLTACFDAARPALFAFFNPICVPYREKMLKFSEAEGIGTLYCIFEKTATDWRRISAV